MISFVETVWDDSFDPAIFAPTDPRRVRLRWIGRAKSPNPGPCLILTAGLHGNEPMGVHAAQNVMKTLRAADNLRRGDVFAFRGNLTALALVKRYIDRDLNRIWAEEHVEEVRKTPRESLYCSEDREMLELLGVLNYALDEASGEPFLMDLHTSSAPSLPFVIGGQGKQFQAIQDELNAPSVHDPKGYFQGSLFSFAERHGLSAMAFEAGRHDDEASACIHEIAVWTVLRALDMVEPTEKYPATMPESAIPADMSIPREIELFHRHGVRPEESFVMKPGFRNFDRVERGQVIAQDNHGYIHSPDNGFVFLPLYQQSGEDGFYVGRVARSHSGRSAE
ncbi:hypothetical protein GF324_04520 [bacterium]|nr:hypothetical protein [bacterium]